MSYQLGVDLGTTYTAAAVRRGDDVRIVHLGTRSASVPSVVLLKDDETTLVGEAAQRRGLSEPDRVAREFKRRIGDTTPLILGSTPYSAEALMARLLEWVVAEVTAREGGPPSSIVVTHPANWGSYKQDLFNQSLRLANVDHASLITEPEAAALHYASQERVETGRIIAVYDLGGGTFDAAILQKTAEGFRHMGAPEGIERLGGIDFDEAVFEHARRALVAGDVPIGETDDQTVAALRRLRAECTAAKEALSSDSDVSVPALFPTAQTDIRLTRAEFESMIRPSLADTMGAMQRAVRGAGIEMDDVDAILLVGGSSRIPLVSELVTSELGRPVVVDAHPKHAIALGAAMWDPAASAGDPTAPAEFGNDAAAIAAAAAVAAPPPAAPAEPPPAAAPPPAAPARPTEVQQPAATPPVPPGAPPQPAVQPVASPQTTAPMPAAAAPVAGVAAATSPQAPTPPTPPDAPSGDASKRTLMIAAGLIAAIVAGVIAVLVLTGGGDDSAQAVDLDIGADPTTVEDAGTTTDTDTDTDTAPTEVAEPAFEPTATREPTPEPTPEPTATTEPTPTVEPSPTPLPFPPDTRRAELTDIALAGGVYEVEYDTLNFEPVIGAAGTYHLHFHWDIYPPTTVGSASSPQNPWIVWDLRGDGDKVFDRLGPGNAPADAEAICVVVANANHAVDNPELADDTVSCIDLPG